MSPTPRRAPADGGLRAMLRQNLPQCHFTAIETGALSPGAPDLEGCSEGASFWVECKRADALAVRLRPLQVAWLERRARAGGRCWVLVRRAQGTDHEELLLYPGSQATELRSVGCRLGATARWPGPPRAWDWEEVLRELCAPA